MYDSQDISFREMISAIAARAEVADRSGCLPADDVDSLHSSGYLLLSIPEVYGGFGLSLAECIPLQIELGQASASTALVAAMQVQMFGFERDTRQWPSKMFARLCKEAIVGGLFNFVASEPLLGSPSRGGAYGTYATPLDGEMGWLLNGHKTWATGGRHLTHMLVRAELQGQAALFLVRQGSEGVRWQDTWRDALSLRASDSHDVYFEDITVPSEHLLTLDAEGAAQAPNAWFPALVAATYLGTAIAARNTLIRYTLERIPTGLGAPIATLPKIQRQIGEMDMKLQAAEALLLSSALPWDGDLGHAGSVMPRLAAAKQFAVSTAVEITELALQVAGGISLTRQLALERYFRDVRAGHMQPPSGDTALEIVGRAAINTFRQSDTLEE